MGARFLVIDGYNLLHAAGLAQTHYAPGQLARQRQRLLARLASLLTLPERARTTVIFDARDPRVDRPARHTAQAMQIVFARPHGDADLFIQHWLDTHPAPRHVTLVSGDKVLQRAARSVGARLVAGGAFLQELTRRSLDRGADLSADEKPGHLTPAEAAAWLREFGDLLPPSAPEPTPAAPGEPAPAAQTAPASFPAPTPAPAPAPTARSGLPVPRRTGTPPTRPASPPSRPPSPAPRPASPPALHPPASPATGATRQPQPPRPPQQDQPPAPTERAGWEPPVASTPTPANSQTGPNTERSHRVRKRGRRTPAKGARSVPRAADKPSGMTDLEYWLGEFGSLGASLELTEKPGNLAAELERWLQELSDN